jgi:hypothetical protein
MSVHIFGIRHHGPGCARGLRAALEALAPDVVLVEGPPDAEGILSLLAHTAMRPPVAMLIYAPDTPHHAVYYPFTSYSPEWQALRFALERGVPAQFMDLPQAIQLARVPVDPSACEEGEGAAEGPGDEPAQAAAAGGRSQEPGGFGSAPTISPPRVGERPGQRSKGEEPQERSVEEDPIGLLAEAAGYADHELWWEQQIEQRQDAVGLFEAIMEAMTALRAAAGPPHEEEAQREAHMRQTIRAAQHDGFNRIAVVCGAWHAPALADLSAPAEDAALLAPLPRITVAATWIPWTNSRLSYRSGYGAGIASPGWYEHLWTTRDRVAIRWLTHVAQLLRGEDLDASSASVIEAVRLADALAALRGLPMPGLRELNEAALTVLCGGDAAPMRLIRERLEIGERLGEVPTETPAVPLQRDLEAQQRRLKLTEPDLEKRREAWLKEQERRGRKVSHPPGVTPLDLDLRKEIDRAQSQLLHRLRLLGIPWGQMQRISGRVLGTFHENWRLEWHPEFAVALIEANVWGNTVATAATAFVGHAADEAADLPRLTELLDGALLAELPGAVERLLARIQAQAAVAADVRHLMDALPALARIARYGDVRQTRAERVLPIADGLFERALIGLPGACASLDDEAAAEMVTSIDHVQEGLNLLDRADQRAAWQAILRCLVAREGIHGLVRGRCCRLLLEQRALDDGELQRLARLALSPVVPAPQAAAWVEGLLRGSGLLLLHEDGLWRALDTWLADLAPDTFVSLLPLLRRAFSGFQPPERRAMGEKLKRIRQTAAPGAAVGAAVSDAAAAALAVLDRERADGVVPVLAHILGVRSDVDH